MRSLLLVLMMLATPSFACAILQPDVQRREDQADVNRQAAIAAQLAKEADFIFLGEATALDERAGTVSFKLARTIKGASVQSVTVMSPGLRGIAVSCWASGMFRSSHVVPGRHYLAYIRSGALLRAGWTTRQARDIPLRRELRIAGSLSKD